MAIFVYIALQWLSYFGVINSSNNLVRKIYQTLGALIEPILDKIRNILKLKLPIDISSILLIVLVGFLERLLYQFMY